FIRDEPHTLRTSESARAEKTTDGWIANVVGGGTVHMSGYFMRMHPVDFRLRSQLGAVDGAKHADWPIDYGDLETHYDRIERDIGVSGRWKAHPFEEPRARDYPLPPLAEHPFAERIDRVGKKLGYHPFPTPRAIISSDYGG